MEVLSNGLPAKLLMLLLTVVMSTNMSGCRGTADAADIGQPPGVVAEQTDAKTDTALADDYDPTKDESLKEPCKEDFSKITICGREFDMPCKIEDFSGKGFSHIQTKDGYAIKYKNDSIGERLSFNDPEPGYLYYFTFSDYDSSFNSVYSINGFQSDMSSSELLNSLGRPYSYAKNEDTGNIDIITYKFDDRKIAFVIMTYTDGKQGWLLSFACK